MSIEAIQKFGLRTFKKFEIKDKCFEAYLTCDYNNLELFCLHAGISKATFYKYFKTFENFQVYVLQRYILEVFFKTGFRDEDFIDVFLTYKVDQLLVIWIKVLLNPDIRYVFEEDELLYLFDVNSEGIVNVYNRYLSARMLAEIMKHI